MRMNKKETIRTKKAWTKNAALRITLAGLSLLFTLIANGTHSLAASYSGDYRYWSQGGSDYQGMREVGCLITAQAKMLYESNVIRAEDFNPDAWYNWLLETGGIASSTNLYMKNHNAPANYASSAGKNLEYLGYWKADDNQLWYNINAGYYTIVHVSGTNTGGSHYVLLDNELSKQTGILYCYDSFSDRGEIGQQLLSRYSIHNGGHVYKGYNPVHTHSYSSSVTEQPTCDHQGVTTYTCSCGSSYTESIPVKEHSYTEELIAPTSNEPGYTLHTCSICGDSYKDSYVDALEDTSDSCIIIDRLANGESADDCANSSQDYLDKTDSIDSTETTDSEYTAKLDDSTVLKNRVESECIDELDESTMLKDTVGLEDMINLGDTANWENVVDSGATADREDIVDSGDTADWEDITDEEDEADWEDIADIEDAADWEDTADSDCMEDSGNITDLEDTGESDWTIASAWNRLKEILFDLFSSIFTKIID